MRARLSVVIHGLVGWAICGATVMIGRQVVSMQTTLVVHAIVAPLAFALLTLRHFSHFPKSSPRNVAWSLLGIVVGLDAVLVAPVFERSYDMFRSVLGTWIPFGSILAASYLVGRVSRHATLVPDSIARNAAEQGVAPDSRPSESDRK